jgi:hypothetical protein
MGAVRTDSFWVHLWVHYFCTLRGFFCHQLTCKVFLPEQCGEIKNPVKSVTYVGNHGVLDIYCGLRLSGLEPETYGLKVRCSTT